MSLGIEIPVNQNIPLTVQLADGSASKFPRASCRDESGAALFGGPVDLIHVGDGLYTDFSKQRSVTGRITVTYIVYSDAGHTTEDTAYNRHLDVFSIIPGGETADASKIELQGLVVPIQTIQGNIFGDTFLQGLIEDSATFGLIQSQTLTGRVEGAQSLIGEVACE
jgi:hypothetical protein